MSNDPSDPAGGHGKPLFWGPDGRYHPPSDIGEIPLDELPGHLELPRAGRGFFNVMAPWPRCYDVLEIQDPVDLPEERVQFIEKHVSVADQLAAKLRELGIDPDQLGA